jgi:hypothetical protein
VNNIAVEAHKDAIIIVQDEITYLDDLYLKGDIPNDVSDIGEARKNNLFTGSYILQTLDITR